MQVASSANYNIHSEKIGNKMFKKKEKTAVTELNSSVKAKEFKKYMRKYWQFYALLLIPILYYIIFRYIPMAGNVIAFRRYRAGGARADACLMCVWRCPGPFRGQRRGPNHSRSRTALLPPFR